MLRAKGPSQKGLILIVAYGINSYTRQETSDKPAKRLHN
jgi:hypothetical protein